MKKNTWRYYLFYTCVPVWQTEISNYWSFFPFYSPPKKIRILKKWKNLLEILSFYICVSKTTILWSKVPEIHSEIELSFWAIFCLFSPLTTWKIKFEEMKNLYGDIKKSQSYDVYFLRYGVWQFFVILGHFLLFYPTIDPEN